MNSSQLQQGYDYPGYSGQPKSLQQGYAYNNSPLSSNAMLNNTGYNNLNLSSRQATQQTYPTPRSSGSPTLNFASLYSNRARLSASKGFDVEDDMEFCPEIPQSQAYTHHKFNPYTSTSFSPTVSPTAQPATTNSPKGDAMHMSPRAGTPRAKKVIEIVNPVTGLKVGSPSITGFK